jgi:hypothetical protein
MITARKYCEIALLAVASLLANSCATEALRVGQRPQASRMADFILSNVTSFTEISVLGYPTF